MDSILIIQEDYTSHKSNDLNFPTHAESKQNPYLHNEGLQLLAYKNNILLIQKLTY